MKLSEFSKKKKITSFEVASVQLVPREDGQKNAILTLKTPIPTVVGSQRVDDVASGESAYLQEWEVEQVTVSAEDMDADGIDINEDGTGSVNCDLRLDVTQRGVVWLTSKSFATYGAEQRQQRSADRKSGNFSRMAERRARVQLAGTDIPATAAANAAVKVTKPAPTAVADKA